MCLSGVAMPAIGPPFAFGAPTSAAEVGVEVRVGDVRVRAALDRVGDVGGGHFAVDRRAEVDVRAGCCTVTVLPSEEISGGPAAMSALSFGGRVRLVRVQRPLRRVDDLVVEREVGDSPGSRCSKSSSSSTVQRPAASCRRSATAWSGRLEPARCLRCSSCSSRCDPHAASARASAATAASAAAVLIDLIESPPVLCIDCPSSGAPRVEGVLQPVAEQVEREHGQQQRRRRGRPCTTRRC